LIYGVNTFDAMSGTWLARFFILPFFGLWKTCLIVGLTDAVVGVVVLWIDLRLSPIEDIRRDGRQHRSKRGPSVPSGSPPWLRKQWMLGGVFAFSGAAAMIYEVGWFRLLGLTMGPSV